MILYALKLIQFVASLFSLYFSYDYGKYKMPHGLKPPTVDTEQQTQCTSLSKGWRVWAVKKNPAGINCPALTYSHV